jgi:hypothetical protein
MFDSNSLIRCIQQVQRDEMRNLAEQSHVAVCFEKPNNAPNSDALGATVLGWEKLSHLCQASTAELHGLVQEIPHKATMKCILDSAGKIAFEPRCLDGSAHKLLDSSVFDALGWMPKVSRRVALTRTSADDRSHASRTNLG